MSDEDTGNINIRETPIDTAPSTSAGMRTRSQTQLLQEQAARSQSFVSERSNVETGLTSIGENIIDHDQFRTLQNELMTALTAQMARLIETNVTACMQKFNPVAPRRTSPLDQIDQLDLNNWNMSGEDQRRGDYGQRSSASRSVESDLLQRPDKVSHIMNGWKLKFTGKGLSIDHFIYRVEALTHQTLEGNFDIMCRNASSLFEGKANEFYWRYHKSVGQIRWSTLCTAFKKQFKDLRDDGDIEEDMRRRKQDVNETFDQFYDAIITLSDKMDHPMSNNRLVRILKNNLRPEIRHEILNIEITSVSELREVCRKRESFLADVKRSHGYYKKTPFKKEVSELLPSEQDLEGSDIEVEDEMEIDALSLICWNCRREGHRYQDCLEERRIFCYGCGLDNTYKPNCAKCAKNGYKSAQNVGHKPKVMRAPKPNSQSNK